nr:keratin-associated protein 12-2-like [Equus caballus]XP_008509442.1 PREDICTED: keratin-associated protein 12-2-like [Equus przewalskii]
MRLEPSQQHNVYTTDQVLGARLEEAKQGRQHRVPCCVDTCRSGIKAAPGRSLQTPLPSCSTAAQPHASMCHTSCSSGCQPACCTPSPCQASCCVPVSCQPAVCSPVSCQPAVCSPVSCQPSVCVARTCQYFLRVPVRCKPTVLVAAPCQSSGCCQSSVCGAPSCQSFVRVPVSCKPAILVAPSCQSSGCYQPSCPTLVCRPISCSSPCCY